MNFFEEATLRLKQQLQKTQDKEIAATLGLSAQSWAGRKKRGSFPEKELRALAQQRPELGIDVEYVLTGGLLTQHQRERLESSRALTLQLPMDAAEKQRLIAQLEEGFLRQATQNAARQSDYGKLIEALNACSDESVALVLQLVAKLRAADMKAR